MLMALGAASDSQNAQPVLGRPIDLIFQFSRPLCFPDGGICSSSSGAPNLISRLVSDTKASCSSQGAGMVFMEDIWVFRLAPIATSKLQAGHRVFKSSARRDLRFETFLWARTGVRFLSVFIFMCFFGDWFATQHALRV